MSLKSKKNIVDFQDFLGIINSSAGLIMKYDDPAR